MAIIVEDGSGVADAVAYVSVEYVDSYFSARGGAEDTTWSGLDTAVKETAIVRATDYLDKRFWKRFKGYKGSSSQALEWPRIDAVALSGWLITDIPNELKKACAEYALRAYKYGALAPDPGTNISRTDMSGNTVEGSIPGFVTQKKEKVGDLEESTSYQPPSTYNLSGSSVVSAGIIPEYPEADLLVEPLLKLGNFDLVRG